MIRLPCSPIFPRNTCASLSSLKSARWLADEYRGGDCGLSLDSSYCGSLHKTMIRIGLATYLAFATVAGPWFCCCSATRLAYELGQLTRSSASRGHSCSQRSGCCHCRNAGKENDDELPPKPRSCPCQDKNGAKVAPASGFDFVKWVRLSVGESAGGSVILVPTLRAPLLSILQDHISVSTQPFLTAQDMLRALHNYLC